MESKLGLILGWLSDSFCRLATGDGFSTGELCTDAEEVFFDASRPLVLSPPRLRRGLLSLRDNKIRSEKWKCCACAHRRQ